jgi:hypothetical protein
VNLNQHADWKRIIRGTETRERLLHSTEMRKRILRSTEAREILLCSTDMSERILRSTGTRERLLRSTDTRGKFLRNTETQEGVNNHILSVVQYQQKALDSMRRLYRQCCCYKFKWDGRRHFRFSFLKTAPSNVEGWQRQSVRLNKSLRFCVEQRLDKGLA